MRIGLHADGGARAGLGHLGRCAALAQAFQAQGHSPVFVDAPAECLPWLKARGLKAAALGSGRYEVLVADSYRLDASYLKRLRRQARTLVLVDDLGDTKAPCDFLLNSNLYAKTLRYRSKAELLLGPEFVPMRKEYWKSAKIRRLSPTLKRLLITTGGSASTALAQRLIAAAGAILPDLDITAVIGPFAHAPASRGRVRYVRSPASLRPLLEACDAAVLAGGQTVYEAAFTAAPMLLFQLGADQNGNAKSLVEARAAIALGKADENIEERLLIELRRLSASRRAALSKRCASLVDGQGALRVAALLTGKHS